MESSNSRVKLWILLPNFSLNKATRKTFRFLLYLDCKQRFRNK